MGLSIVLAMFYVKYTFLIQFVVTLDISSHWLQMYWYVRDMILCILIFIPWGAPFVLAHWCVERKVIKILIMYS